MPDWQERQKWVNRHKQTITLAARAMERLVEARTTIKKVNGQLEQVDEEQAKALKKQGKGLNDSISVMMEWFLPAKDFKGYDHVTQRINDYLERGLNFLSGSESHPGPNGVVAIERAEAEVQAVVDKINGFFEKDWLDYRKAVENTKRPVFQDYKPLKKE